MKAARFVALWRVTYRNPIDGKVHPLIDNVTEDEARAIHAKFSDKRNRFLYLPEVTIEPTDAIAQVDS